MSYSTHNLSVLAYANGFTLWHYVTAADGYSDLLADGYFDAAHDMLRAGDMIIAVAKTGGGTLFVSSLAGGAVSVSHPATAQSAA